MTADNRPVIRPAAHDDIEALCLLNRDLQSVHHQAVPQRFKPPSDRQALRSHFEEVLANPDCGILLALCDGVAAGYAAYEIKRNPETVFTYANTLLYIHHISVKAASHRRGVGSSLMEALEQMARDRGLDMVQLGCWSFNQPALRFYQNLGYRTFKELWWKLLP